MSQALRRSSRKPSIVNTERILFQQQLEAPMRSELSSSLIIPKYHELQAQRLSKTAPTEGSQSSLTMNKLNFANIELYGRDYEIKQLRLALKRCTDEEIGGREIVLISGHSGCGKTALANKLREPTKKAGGHFVVGKFDLQQSTEPYTAFRDAFVSLIDHIAFSGDRELITSIREAIGSELVFLAHLMPNIGILLCDDAEEEQTEDETVDDEEVAERRLSGKSAFDRTPSTTLVGPENRNKLHYLMKQFLQIICSPKRPLVLLIDDLQWADSSSLDLMETMLVDVKIRGLLFVGCFRDNEVSATHPLSSRIRAINEEERNSRERNNGSQAPLSTAKIFVENLSVTDINRLLEEVLSSNLADTQELADVVHLKTQGNVFFVIEFLKSLKNRGLLRFNMGMLKWGWDVEEILSNTHVTDNVAMLIREEMNFSLGDNTRELLPIMACLGHTFEASMVSLIVSKLFETEGESTIEEEAIDIHASLEECVEKQILESSNAIRKGRNISTTYWFGHDQIQQAALYLVEVDDLVETQFEIGKIMVKHLDNETIEKNLFVAVNLLNRGIGHPNLYSGKFDNFIHARLNLLAGKKAKELAAFVTSADYFNTGITILGDDGWKDETYTGLNLKLHSNAAESEYCNGNYEGMRYYVVTVLKRTDVDFKNKVKVYAILIQALRAQGNYAETIEYSIFVLSKMGIDIPQKNIQLSVVKNLLKTKRMLAKKTPEDLTRLPRMKDNVLILVSGIIDGLLISTYVARPELFPVVIFKFVQFVVKNGLNRFAPAAFTGYAIILCVLGEIKSGYEYGKLGLSLVESLNAFELKGRLTFLFHAFISHWMAPAGLSLRPCVDGYQAGMKAGDVENAMLSICAYFLTALNVGKNLCFLEGEMRIYVAEMIQYQQDTPYLNAVYPWQFVLNLMGRSDDPTILTGEAMNEDDLTKRLEEKENNKQVIDCMKVVKLILAYYFGNYELAWLMVQQTADFEKTNPSHTLYWRKVMFEGLTAFAMARYTRNLKWEKRAVKVTKLVTKLVKKGNVNFVHVLNLLLAEEAAFYGEREEAMERYTQAITASGRAGLVNDKALVNERVGEFLLSIGEDEEASFHLNVAHQHYFIWGAIAKAQQLRSKHFYLMQQTKHACVLENGTGGLKCGKPKNGG